jgi:DNA invertase Pin-like site-specific DNA recombinase
LGNGIFTEVGIENPKCGATKTQRDRLARSLRQLIDTTVMLNEHGVELHSLTENITTTPGGKLTFHIFAALAEFKRDILRQRVNG